MDKNYYYQYYHFERQHWWFRARAEILRTYLEKQVAEGKTSLRILNVGSATGGSTEWLLRFGSVDSMEFDQDCIDFIRDKVNFVIQQGSILELPYADSQYDLVCAFDVIEHVEDDFLAVKELCRVTRPGGSVLVTVPAGMHLWSDHDVINHHFRRYTEPQLRSLFLKMPGHIEFASFFNYKLYPIIRLARLFSNTVSRLRKQNPKSDFETFQPGVLNRWLYSIMQAEKVPLANKRSKQYGVSILLHWKNE